MAITVRLQWLKNKPYCVQIFTHRITCYWSCRLQIRNAGK